MTERIWKLTLTEPGEPTRTREVPQSEMVGVLHGLMYGEIPASAVLTVDEIVSAPQLAQAA
jgi:hypothetical protein